MMHLHPERVEKLARSLAALPVADNLAEQLTPPIHADPEIKLRVFLFAAAICHATKGGLKGIFKGTSQKGWDYLYHAFAQLAEREPASLSLDSIKELNAERLHEYLSKYAENPEIHLPDLDRRAEILSTLAKEIEKYFDGQVMNIVERSQSRVGGATGAYAHLSRLRTFQDPLQKKSSVFLMLAEGSKIMRIEDQQHLMPMIDYHLIREMLRTGCIEIDEPELRAKLIQKQKVDPLIEEQLREFTKQICDALVEKNHLPMHQVHNILWAHARSYCRHAPVCLPGHQPENLSFNEFTNTTFHGSCPFQAWCPGALNPPYRDLWEPMTTTENY